MDAISTDNANEIFSMPLLDILWQVHAQGGARGQDLGHLFFFFFFLINIIEE